MSFMLLLIYKQNNAHTSGEIRSGKVIVIMQHIFRKFELLPICKNEICTMNVQQ